MPKMQSQIRYFLTGFPVQLETQTRARIFNIVTSAGQSYTEGCRGTGACRAHALTWGFRKGLSLKALLWMNLRGWIGVGSPKRRGCVRQKKTLWRKEHITSAELHLVRWGREKEECSKKWNDNPDFIMELKHFDCFLKGYSGFKV